MSGWVIWKQIDDVPSVPWANGAGTTHELVSYAESALLGRDGPRWRLSIALLDRPGGFSPLPGIDRTFLLVGGDAALSVDGVVHDLTTGDVLRFTGEQDVVLVAVTPGCHAVNLMVERASGLGAPRLVRGTDEDAALAVALASTQDVAQFDLLARDGGTDGRLELPAGIASLVR